MDYQNIGVNDNETYRSWNITELIKNHYRKGNVNGQVSTFVLEAYDAENMHTYYRAKSQMFLKNSLGYPILQIIYRDTKGVEEYFTYQTHVVGNAGIAYVGDYNGQLIVIKSVADYESTLMSYGLNLVYNSAYHDQYFTDNGLLIHSKDFSKMRTGVGWKLSAQETIVEVSIDSVDQWGHEVTSNWLVYNDSDGTEHYFWRSSSNASVYEDEDGLNLTITKSGSDFTMKDKQDNEKFFKNGYLTKLTDANGNKIHIVYNNGNPDANVPTSSGTNKITAIYSQPNGLDSTKIFGFTYDANGFLTNIQETYSSATDDQRKSFQIAYETKNGKVYLKQIKNMIGAQQAESARYDYTNSICSLDRMTDSESGVGICYTYNKSMTGHRIGSYYMYSGDGDERSTGSTVTVSSDEHRKTIYRDSGADKTKNTADDIVITYLFNQCGQTINVSSRDQGGTLLGVTSSAYTSNSGTSRKNNRLTQSVSTGQSGANLLRNGGFENSITGDDGIPAASGWSKTTKSGSAARRDAVPHSGKGHYNLYSESAEGRQMIIQTVKLKGGSTYTASAYVKLPQIENVVAGKGVYLEIHDAAGNLKAKGDVLSYPANENIDGGFQRINLSYQAPSDATYKICIVWDGVQGTVRVDDVQMELAETPSSFSHVSNGSFENGYTDWSRDCIELTAEEEASETQKTIYGSGAFATKGEPGRAAYIAQTIMLNKSSDTTFMLSGWSKAYSIASVQKITDSTNNGTGKKFWGISLMFTYSDNQTETHFLPFSEYIREWQYASMAVVPKRLGEIITTATVRCCYYNNATTARFDNISLTEEPAQTYVYNEKGSLVSVKSGGKGTEQYSYDTGTQNLIKIQTPDSGTYEYEYKTSGNKHLPVKVTNETVSMEVVYDSYGQATETTLSNTEDSAKMKSSAVYGDGLLISQKDNSGAETKYFYTEARDLCVTQNAKGEQIHTYQDLLWDRTDITYQKNLISVQYQYLNGNLLQINRGGYLKEKTESQENAAVAEKLEQIYGFTYDEFGNRTKAKISDKAGTKVWTLATYDYSDDFENMESMTYGPADAPLATIHYTYDKLDRVKSVTYDNNNEEDVTYGYKYSTDGSLSEITESGEKIYDYTYDSLGRLIYSTRFENGIPVLRTSHQYDTSDRITIQNWQIGNEEFSESYEYHSADGTLKSMATGGDTLEFNYNHLKQLSKRTSPKLDMDYQYQTVMLDGEVYHTNRVSEIQYTTKGDNAGALPALRYSYDVLGNITEVDAGAENLISYEYDKQNQLTSAITPDSNFTYVYDTYGNILSKTEEDLNSAQTETYTYTYGDEGWKDLLTAVTYKTFDGVETTHELEYDAVGNPIEYFNGKRIWEFEWTNGRQLKTAATTIDGQEVTIANTYDIDGIRETKTVGDVLHKYTTLDGKVVRETYGATKVDYFYDNDGRPYKLVIKEGATTAIGYFVLNLQGDVIAIIDSDGAVAVEYEYDAWGKEIGHAINGNDGSKLYGYNALKYRGYYYDVETGFYYVSSRYYDPEIGRFINADSSVSGVGGDIRGYNLYSYCFNNPVNMSDPDGNWPKLSTILKTVAVVATAVVAVAAVAAVAAPMLATLGASTLATTIASTATTVMAQATAVAAVSVVASASSQKAETRKTKTYSVYFLADENKTTQYVGRVTDSGYNARMKYHRNTRGLEPAHRISGLSYQEARGLEEIGMIECHTLNALNPINNQIHGISSKNGMGESYMKAACDYLFNRAEDELLNIFQ